MRRLSFTRAWRAQAGAGEPAATAGWLEHAGIERCIVALRGEWDASTSQRARDLLDAVTECYRIIVLDLLQVTFADSSLLGLAVVCQASQRAAGGELRVVVAPGPLPLMLDSTGLREVLDVYPSREAALRGWQPA